MAQIEALSKPRAQFEVVPTDVAPTEAATAEEAKLEDPALSKLTIENIMSQFALPLREIRVKTVIELRRLMGDYDDEELKDAVGFTDSQLRCLRLAAESRGTSDSAHEAAQPVQHQAASTLLPPQQEHISPNQHRQLAIPYLERCEIGRAHV